MFKRAFKTCLPLLALVLLSNTSDAQVIPRKDTVLRDIGISVNWRYLPFPPQSTNVFDILGGFHFAFETRADRFWIQTGILINWNQSIDFRKSSSFFLSFSSPYEFELLKRRLLLGFGPISGIAYHNFRSDNNRLVENVAISFGVNLEITVPIWKGLSLESCSDAGVGVFFYGVNKGGPIFTSARLVSFGINYRIPAYRK